MIIKGEDTMQGLVGEPPKKIILPYNLVTAEDLLRPKWNGHFIAIVPYCFKCKVPLNWHTPPDGNALFDCPKCKRKWIKDKNWGREAKATHNKLSNKLNNRGKL